MVKFLAAAVLLTSSLAFAQVERDVIDLNDQIRQLVLSRSYDQKTLLRVKNQLENTLLTLGGTIGAPSGAYISSLKCVSRDNDNMGPYIFAAELSDFTMKRFPEHQFKSLASCQNSSAAARAMAGALHSCVSRDGDDVKPFVIATFSLEHTSKRSEGFKSVEQCQNAVGAARTSSEAWTFCAPRDNDGSQPWIRVVVRQDGTSARQSDQYSGPESCQQN